MILRFCYWFNWLLPSNFGVWFIILSRCSLPQLSKFFGLHLWQSFEHLGDGSGSATAVTAVVRFCPASSTLTSASAVETGSPGAKPTTPTLNQTESNKGVVHHGKSLNQTMSIHRSPWCFNRLCPVALGSFAGLVVGIGFALADSFCTWQLGRMVARIHGSMRVKIAFFELLQVVSCSPSLSIMFLLS